jgi:hypothetical protein
MRLVGFALCFVMAVSAAHAQTTGDTVLHRCQKTIHLYENNGGPVKDQFDEGWCVGWVDSALGVEELHAQWREVTGAKPGILDFCLPEKGVPVIQGVQVVVKYLTDHPQQLHVDGMTVTIMALKAGFPCKS